MAFRLRSFHPPPVIGFILLLALAVAEYKTNPLPGHHAGFFMHDHRPTKSPPSAGFFIAYARSSPASGSGAGRGRRYSDMGMILALGSRSAA